MKRWGGTEAGCLVNKIRLNGYGSEQVVMRTDEYGNYIRSRESYYSKNDNDSS